MIESTEGSFGDAMRRRLIEDFVVSYYNGSLKANLAEKNPATGRDVEYLMDAPQFDRTRKAEIWSYSNAIGTGYQYRVVYKDRRFSDLERLMGVYSGAVQVTEEDKGLAEQSLYQLILLMIKEGRLPKTFKIQSAQEAQEQKVIAMVEELNKTMEELGRRVRAIEEQLAAQSVSQPESDVPQTQVIALPSSQSTLLE
jgi:CRISPR/Cas system type I-B associated protein Csh2 (Cas7 group RAMP superfamily)